MSGVEYIKNKLRELNSIYNVEQHLNSYTNRHIKQQWNEDSKNVYKQWLSVKSISDVEIFINGFIGTVKQYENVNGVFTDAYDMDLALYKVVNAIQKMAQCYDSHDFNFHTLNTNDIDEIFSTLHDGLNRMNNVNMHRAMQD